MVSFLGYCETKKNPQKNSKKRKRSIKRKQKWEYKRMDCIRRYLIRTKDAFYKVPMCPCAHMCVCVCVYFQDMAKLFIRSQLVNRLMHHHFKHYYVHSALWHLVMSVCVFLHACICVCAHTFQFHPSEAGLPLLNSKYQLGGNKLP